MKLAMGSFAMPALRLEQVIPMLAEIGYDGIEICSSPRHAGSLPDEMDALRRVACRALLQQHRLGVPAFFILRQMLADDAQAHGENLEFARRVAQLARDLGMGQDVVLALGIGGKSALFEAQREAILSAAGDYVKLAEQEGLVLAGEAHYGAAIDTSKRALWLIQAVGSPRFKLLFDPIHMYRGGEALEDSVRALAPVSAHPRIRGVRLHPDHQDEMLLPGEGDLDMTAYVRAMHRAGWTGYITVQVSGGISAKPGYDARQVALTCHRVMRDAMRQAGVPRA
jgi:sugar phosphate isomerase/epimerase